LTSWLPWVATTISPNSCGVLSSPASARRTRAASIRSGGGDFDVAREDRALDILHREAARRQRPGLHPDTHRVAPLTEDAGAADARQALESRLDEPVRDVGELHQVVVLAGERQPEERLRVGRLLRDHRLEHVYRQAAPHPRHLVAHVLRRDLNGRSSVNSSVMLLVCSADALLRVRRP